jgi:hypothetical protein
MSAPKICVTNPNTILVNHQIASSIPTYRRKRKPVISATATLFISTKKYRPRRHVKCVRARINQVFLVLGFSFVLSHSLNHSRDNYHYLQRALIGPEVDLGRQGEHLHQEDQVKRVRLLDPYLQQDQVERSRLLYPFKVGIRIRRRRVSLQRQQLQCRLLLGTSTTYYSRIPPPWEMKKSSKNHLPCPRVIVGPRDRQSSTRIIIVPHWVHQQSSLLSRR